MENCVGNNINVYSNEINRDNPYDNGKCNGHKVNIAVKPYDVESSVDDSHLGKWMIVNHRGKYKKRLPRATPPLSSLLRRIFLSQLCPPIRAQGKSRAR